MLAPWPVRSTYLHMSETHILYNGACPICRAEILQYQAQAEAHGAPLRFDDLGQTDLSAWDMTPDQASRRLHARLPDGTRLSGIPAFVVIWRELPRLRWLARVANWPVIGPLVRIAYDRLAAPLLYKMHRRRQRRAARG